MSYQIVSYETKNRSNQIVSYETVNCKKKHCKNTLKTFR